MTLKEHYSINSRQSIKPYIKLIIFLLLFITVSHTYARYTFTTEPNGKISLAKWNIKINNEDISYSTSGLNTNIQLLNVTDNTTDIDAGDECYFDITINPKTTEVSVFYSISIDLDESNLPDGTKIIKYEKYINTGANEELSNTQSVNSETTSISEKIELPQARTALDNDSIRRYRIYCKIPFPIDVEENEQYTVTPTITVEQYIN